jgi:hypothetical protein
MLEAGQTYRQIVERLIYRAVMLSGLLPGLRLKAQYISGKVRGTVYQRYLPVIVQRARVAVGSAAAQNGLG